MSDKEENKKDTKKEEVKQAAEKDASIKVEKKELKNEEVKPEISQDKVAKKEEIDDEEIDIGLGADDELPEEIKKKLEKKKIERAKKKHQKKKKRGPKQAVKTGNAFIKATYNNTIVTLTDLSGNVISWASAGVAGFKGPKKATPYAAQIITKIACLKAKEEYNLSEVNVFIKGVGTGRESAVRALNANGIIINSIKDITSIPHNGCRPKKPRRV